MQDTASPQNYTQEDYEITSKIGSLSFMNFKIAAFSPEKISELSEYEETSSIFKESPIRKSELLKDFSSTESEPELILSSSNKLVVSQLVELKDQVAYLKKKFSSHREEVGQLVGENMMLKSKIIRLQESLLSVNELSVKKSTCNCNLF